MTHPLPPKFFTANPVSQPVKHSDCAAPVLLVVPVVKQDGPIRLCDDIIAVNITAKLDSYPLPPIDDLFSSLSGCQEVSKLDLVHACKFASTPKCS